MAAFLLDYGMSGFIMALVMISCAAPAYAEGGALFSDIAPVAIIIIIMVLSFAAFAVLSNDERVKAIEKLAVSIGAQFQHKAPELLSTELCRLPLFHKEDAYAKKSGMSHFCAQSGGDKFRNLLRGGDLGDAIYFDYYYVAEGADNGPVSVRQTVVAFKTRRYLQGFVMRPESRPDKAAAPVGFTDINFPENPQFSKLYHMESPSPKDTQTFFSPSAVMYFSQNKGWSLEGSGNWLIMYRQGKTVSGGDYPAFINETIRVMELFSVQT